MVEHVIQTLVRVLVLVNGQDRHVQVRSGWMKIKFG